MADPHPPAPPLSALEPPPGSGFGPGKVLGLLLLFLGGCLGLDTLIWVSSQVFAGRPPTLPEWATLTLGGLVLAGVASLGFLDLGTGWRQALAGNPHVSWRKVGLLPIVWLACLVTEVALLGWAFSRWPWLADPLPDYHFPLAWVPVVLVAPIAEEAFFRGVLCEGLARRYGDRIGIGVSASLFALAHYHWILLPWSFIFGLLMGVLQRRTASIRFCVAIHFLNNALAIMLG